MIKKGIKLLFVLGILLGTLIGNQILRTPRIVVADSGQLQHIPSDESGRVETRHSQGTMNAYADYLILSINGEIVFCLDPITYAYEVGYTGTELKDNEEITKRLTMTPELYDKLMFISYFGYQLNPTHKHYHYTQVMIWEEIGYAAQSFTGTLSMEEYQSFKADVISKINDYKNNPSWHGETHTLKMGESLTLTDNYNVVNHLDIPAEQNGFQFSNEGNNLIITPTTSATNGELVFRQNRDNHIHGTSIVYRAPDSQTVAKFKLKDPQFGVLNLNIGKQGAIKIIKTDSETGQPISNVEFALFEKGGTTPIQTGVTNEQGIVEFTELDNKHFDIKETRTKETYRLNNQVFSVTVPAGETVTVRFKNAPQKGVIELSKTGQVLTSWKTDNNGVHTPVYQEQIIGGATFQFTNVETGHVFTLTTQAGQVLRTDELPLGSYDVVETSAPKGYIKDSQVYRVNLTPQAQTVRLAIQSLSVYNERKTLTIPVQKVFENSKYFTNEKTATIGLYTKQDYTENGVALPKNSLVGYAVVTENQQVTFKNLPSELVTYVKELSTSEAYTVNEKAFDVTVSEKDKATTNTIVVNNQLKRGSQELVKVDASSKEVVAGAVFRLVAVLDDKSEKEVGTYTTDKNGKIRFENLEYGKYFTQEIKTLPGYFLNPTKFFFEVTGKVAQGVKPIEVANEPIPAIVTEATSETGGKVVYKHEQIKEVANFSNLVIGQEYEAVANMFTGDGQLLGTQKRTFIAKVTEHQEIFYFDVPVGHYGDTVFGEELYRNGEKVAVHFDLTNKKQTVKVLEPKINTLAQIGGTKEMTVGEHRALVDILKYEDFKNDKVLVNTWVVKYGTDEIVGEKVEQVLGLDGNGEVTVKLDKIDTSKLPAGKYTIMEQVFEAVENNGKPEKGNLISEHVDNKDENQSFTINQPILPYTGSENWVLFSIIGLLVVLGGAWILSKKRA